MFIELIKFFAYSSVIVLVSKYIIVNILRKLAETLKLKAKTVGNIAGYATSIPELLTIVVSSFSGLISASVFNILSSNIINLIQYMLSIFLNNNQKALKNKAIMIDLILVIITILVPIIILVFNVELRINIIPLFIILYVLFIYLNFNTHKLYLNSENIIFTEIIEKEKKWDNYNNKIVIKYSFYLLCVGIVLFIIGELLGKTLENLSIQFSVPQFLIGVLLGFVTSIPELITFFESQKHYIKKKDEILGVVEATNNLFTSNILNLFVIQSIGIVIYSIFV